MKRVVGYVLAALPYGSGFVVGFLVKLFKLLKAAVVEGFKSGSRV